MIRKIQYYLENFHDVPTTIQFAIYLTITIGAIAALVYGKGYNIF